MSEDLKNLFFAKNNQDFLFNLANKQVNRHHNYDISKHKGFKQNFQKMALIVFNSTPEEKKNVVSLNEILVEKSTQYFNKVIETKKNRSGVLLNSQDLNTGLTNTHPNQYLPGQQSGQQIINPYTNSNQTQMPNQNQYNPSNIINSSNLMPFSVDTNTRNEISQSERNLYQQHSNYDNTINSNITLTQILILIPIQITIMLMN